MATETRSKPATDDRVYHPLDQLRGIIRRYVVIEGVLSVGIFLVAWFTLALALDYGVFKAFHWDWAQDADRWLRGVTLGLALATLAFILVFRIVRRFLTEFSYPALALVLERKFPKVLGDRLITAVELADIQGASKYGYSAAMIRKTIEEARERVATVPVSEVFNWRRLWLMTLLAVGSVVALVGIGFGSHAIAAGQFDATRAAWRSYHVSAILFERDVLLRNTPWPRRALVQLKEVDRDNKIHDMKDTGIRTPRDGDPPRLVVLAYRWVIADPSHFDGWRPLLWNDVTQDLVGVPVPALERSTGTGDTNVSKKLVPEDTPADKILENPVVRAELNNVLGLEKYQELQKVFERLDDIANDPAMERKLRKLEEPGEVTFKYTGLKSAGDGVLKPEGNNLYAGDVTGLREDVLFTVRARDFRTPQRAITLIPPPTLLSLTRVEYQPAYLHYASPQNGGWSDLAPLRQMMPEENLSLTGDRSVFAVPSGTELTITGTTEKPIAKAWGRPKVGKFPGGKPGSAALVELPVTEGNKFTVKFDGDDKITSAVEFDFVFDNEDKVRSSRQVMIQVVEDQTPNVELALEVLRKVGREYWVTPRAKIFFNPESNIRDDNGISKIAYTVAYELSDADEVRLKRAERLGQTIAPQLALRGAPAATVAFANYVHQVRVDEANTKKTASFPMRQFNDLDGRLTRDTLDLIKMKLKVPLAGDKPQLVKRLNLATEVKGQATRNGGRLESFKWLVTGDYFDIKALGLEVPAGDIQPRYKLDLVVEATDTNVTNATGAKVGRHEPITLMVVSAADLLVEISRDEERLGAKLDEALKKLDAAKGKYAFVKSKSDQTLPEELDAVKVRAKDAMQDIAKARETVQAVAREFRRLEKEAVVNQLPENNLEDTGKFANRLDRALGEVPDTISPKEDKVIWDTRSAELPFGALTPKATFTVTEKQLEVLQRDFDEGRWPVVLVDLPDGTRVNRFTQANNSIIQLEAEIALLRRILGEAQSQDRITKEFRKLLEEQDRLALAIKRWEQISGEERTKKTPKLGDLGQLFLAKGETKKIKQAISWRQYLADDLAIKVTASDPSLTVPAELKLDFEKNQFEFEYEVRAGAKEGEYTITLTPQVGDPVAVKITVK